MTNNELINYVKEKGACTIKEITEHFHISKLTLLQAQRRTKHLIKPNRKQDIIIYIENPVLPEKYSDLLIDFRKVETIEDIIFLYIVQEKSIPSYYYIKLMNDNYGFPYNWHNRNVFMSSRKHILNMLKDCGFLDKDNNFLKNIE